MNDFLESESIDKLGLDYNIAFTSLSHACECLAMYEMYAGGNNSQGACLKISYADIESAINTFNDNPSIEVYRNFQPTGEYHCILSIGNPQNGHQNSLFLEREFLVFGRTRFLHSEVLSGASMHAASDNFSRRT